ncbi:MAG: ABC transporter permease [Cyclobacteriaceae bacterium]|mgnify:CR=1 FL=1|nr:ABC transporter permease [Cyclobacteriaceae bacterium]MCB0498292.1 ABC transporter permease [Cyclobacteriaceae bacterium]MCB9239016.1 ABC transporter permease [Flammeovirgaceae bacterium]MCO5270738.1 ABC transporter permease [Cyclobacteriaceae bacterium]MCW5903524.1 ABC transporter permease [Cyclobacteriaceae bacterium]
MLRSFLTLSLRNLFRKNKLYTFVNIAGLAVGFASVWLVSLFIYDEYTFDRHYSATDRIYRIVLDFTSEGNVTSWAKTSAPIGQYLQGAYPEVEHVTRLRKNPGTDLLLVGEKQFYEPRLYFADSTFFQLFDIPFKAGNRELALVDKNSIVITEELARKYFGSTDVLGKSIRYDNNLDLKITGIMEPMHPNSHFIADAFVTFSSLHELLGEKRLNHWGQFDHYTYVQLTKGSSPNDLEAKFPDLLKRNAPEWVGEKESLFLQPLTRIHLHSDRKDEISANSNEKFSYILGTIALFILLMACANFINLSTATQLSRTKETAIQKALGANSNTLSTYFFIESGIVCVVALVISLVLAYLTLPYFNLSTGKQVNLVSSEWLMIPAIGITLLISFITGLFPAAQTHRQIATNINTTKGLGISKSNLRTGLVIFQFSVSIFLIMSTWVVFSQLQFLESARFGFESDNVIVVPVKDRSKNDQFNTFSNEIEKLPGISKVSFSSSTPGANNSLTYTYTISGTELGEQPLATFITDDNFFELYQIKIKKGRVLNPLSTDTLTDVILNEAAVKMFNLSQPIGSLVSGKVKGRVVGVVENFNYASLHDELKPLIMYAFKPTFRLVSVKLSDPQTGIAAMEKKWPELYDGYPLEYGFLNDMIQQLYGTELQLTEAYTTFSLIAIIIAGVGLIGLTTHLLNRKLKEISIRKTFGSSIAQILKWVYSGYMPIVLISSALACSAGYYFLENWLNNFSFRIELKLIYFAIPPLLMTFILLITTGFQSVRASLTNPVKYLREE